MNLCSSLKWEIGNVIDEANTVPATVCEALEQIPLRNREGVLTRSRVRRPAIHCRFTSVGTSIRWGFYFSDTKFNRGVAMKFFFTINIILTLFISFVKAEENLISITVYPSKLDNRISGSKVDVIDNCGHMMLLEEADRVLKVLKSFITTHYPSKN